MSTTQPATAPQKVDRCAGRGWITPTSVSATKLPCPDCGGHDDPRWFTMPTSPRKQWARYITDTWNDRYTEPGPGPSPDELAADALGLLCLGEVSPATLDAYGTVIEEAGEEGAALLDIALRVVDHVGHGHGGIIRGHRLVG